MDAKICKKCWKEFSPMHYKQSLCHDCLWHPCVICWKIINSIWHETCWRECWMIYKSRKMEKERLEKIWKRYCIICWKEFIDVRLNIKTCWNHDCIEKAKKINQHKIWKDSVCKRCWKEYRSYNNRKYCDECYFNRICPICWWKIHWWRYETCSKWCAVKLTQKLHWNEYKEYAKVMHTPEAKAKASIWKKWRPNPKNRWPKYNRRWKNNHMRRWWVTIWTRRWIQHSTEYKHLIKEVYKRDDYTCQICWQKWWMLNIHHIRTRDYYPELRYDKNNLVTLCESCHKKVHKMWWWTHWATETFSILFKITYEL